jgi:hypothetical protein
MLGAIGEGKRPREMPRRERGERHDSASDVNDARSRQARSCALVSDAKTTSPSSPSHCSRTRASSVAQMLAVAENGEWHDLLCYAEVPHDDDSINQLARSQESDELMRRSS